MKKNDTEQEQSALEEIYYEERRKERHERNLKRKKRQRRNRNLALFIAVLAVLGGAGYFYKDQMKYLLKLRNLLKRPYRRRNLLRYWNSRSSR